MGWYGLRRIRRMPRATKYSKKKSNNKRSPHVFWNVSAAPGGSSDSTTKLAIRDEMLRPTSPGCQARRLELSDKETPAGASFRLHAID